jgi:hypothetical protein
MSVHALHPSRIRPQLVRSRKRTASAVQQRPAGAPPGDAREREAGGPEDRALYQCPCGCTFEASVSTTVGCPHCGGAQAW